MPARRSDGVKKRVGNRKTGFNQALDKITLPGKTANAAVVNAWKEMLQDLKDRDAKLARGKGLTGSQESGELVYDKKADAMIPEWEAEAVIDSKTLGGVLTYFVVWKGYKFENSSWEPITHLQNCQELIDTFYEAFPAKPGGPEARKPTRSPNDVE